MTLFALRDRDSPLAVRFAVSPAWETQAAVQALADGRGNTYGRELADGSARTVEIGDRGLVLMPSVFLWPHVATVTEPPWLPAIIYPATGIAGLWQTSPPPPDALGRLLGRSRAPVLTCLDEQVSTTVVAAMTGLSPAGASAHLLALRHAGLLSATRHGHEVRYQRTGLGSALLRQPHHPRP